MGIGVGDFLGSEEGAVLFHPGVNGLVGFLQGLPGDEVARLGGLAAGSVHRDHQLDFRVILADVKVLHTESRGGVDAAGAAFQGDVVAHDDQGGAV